MFVDNIKLKFTAGKGGNGIVAWRREKYLPKGGPYGGNGGKGGDILIKVDEHAISLEAFRYKKAIQAENGNNGGPNNRIGRNGKNLIIKVPLGTIIKDITSNEILFEFTNKEQSYLICKGGKGGKGNTHFKSSTNQAPNICTPGIEGTEKSVELELKLIADIGLVGFPNAGKSTLMSKLTKNKVKIAAYPFTTLNPNIGLLEFEDYTRAFIADIPGIIKDAHLNKGLGLSFLKHIERTSMLLYIIDSTSEDPINDFKILQKEIEEYNPKILQKPFLIALNKLDILEDEKVIDTFKKKYPYSSKTLFEISALENQNFNLLIKSIKTLTKQ